jgi:hypothetical protein
VVRGYALDASEANKKGNGGTYFLRSWNIDYRRLLVEWLIIGGLAATGYLLMDAHVLSSIASRRDIETARAGWAARHPRTVRVLACSVLLLAVLSICVVIVLRLP